MTMNSSLATPLLTCTSPSSSHAFRAFRLRSIVKINAKSMPSISLLWIVYLVCASVDIEQQREISYVSKLKNTRDPSRFAMTKISSHNEPTLANTEVVQHFRTPGNLEICLSNEYIPSLDVIQYPQLLLWSFGFSGGETVRVAIWWARLPRNLCHRPGVKAWLTGHSISWHCIPRDKKITPIYHIHIYISYSPCMEYWIFSEFILINTYIHLKRPEYHTWSVWECQKWQWQSITILISEGGFCSWFCLLAENSYEKRTNCGIREHTHITYKVISYSVIIFHLFSQTLVPSGKLT